MSHPRAPLPDASPAPQPRIQISGRLGPRETAAVTRLTEAAAEADGVGPLSEHVSLHLRYGGEGPDRNILLLLPRGSGAGGSGDGGSGDGAGRDGGRDGGGDGDEVVGYAHLDPTDQVAGSAAELVVHPEHRRHGYGRMLVDVASAGTPDGRLRLWAHGDQPAARRLATSMGFKVVRRLEQWRRSLAGPLPDLPLPDGVRLRAFRPGRDEQAWLELNARAFAGHPEQGGWTERDLQARMQEAWFDPGGFLVAEEGPAMIAFHWTKVHGGDDHGHGHDPIGEVYVVGVDPAQQGRGLGRAITVAGLRWLQARGLPQAMLYVEADNVPALAVYRGLGFTYWDTDVMFYRNLPDDRA